MKVIFCLPGREFSDAWVRSWMDTLSTCSRNGIEWAFSMAYDPVVYYARNRVLGGNNVDGREQKPFRGQVQYDYQFWIDSDMVWSGEDVLRLIKLDKPIASGCYMMANNQDLPIVENLDWDRLAESGTFRFLSRDELNARLSPFTASYAGFGFMCIRQGVMESMEYPWFQPRFVDYKGFHDFTAEDVSFCWRAAELGHDIWVDPSVRVGHQKSLTLMP
jgi:GT2 family glycosyltransferase